MRVQVWTVDENYSCDGQLLDDLDERKLAFSAGALTAFYVWLVKPNALIRNQMSRPEVQSEDRNIQQESNAGQQLPS